MEPSLRITIQVLSKLVFENTLLHETHEELLGARPCPVRKALHRADTHFAKFSGGVGNSMSAIVCRILLVPSWAHFT